jgi:glycosyltransferase involved in cell wall biosynthesis
MPPEKVLVSAEEIERAIPEENAPQPILKQLLLPIPIWARIGLSSLVSVLPLLCIVAIVLKIAFRTQPPRVRYTLVPFLSALLIVSGFLATVTTVLVVSFMPVPAIVSNGLPRLDEQADFHRMLPLALNRCDGILTVSETSKELIHEAYRVSADRIAIVPNSVKRPPMTAGRSLPVAEPYFPMVGASWSHKNIEALLCQHALWTGTYRLKIVSGPGPTRTRLKQMAASLGISDRVEFLSGLAPQDLERLCAGCSALAYPSLMEGFDLPPLEAMARLRPAIVSDLPVFRELYGEYALYVRLDRSDSWQQAFAALKTIPSAHLAAAQKHALGYERQRMARSLRDAIGRFWPDSLPMQFEG